MNGKTLHLLAHSLLLALSFVALFATAQACSGGSGDVGFDGSYGGLYR